MPETAILNIVDTAGWIGLLKFQSLLLQMAAGQTLDVLVDDPDTIEDLSVLVSRSNDRVLNTRKIKGCYRIRVQKGDPDLDDASGSHRRESV